MKTATITWVLPVTRTSGGTLPPADIASVEISLSGDLGQNFIIVATVPSSLPQEVVIPELEPGDYIVRGVVEDNYGGRSAPTSADFTVIDDSVPSALGTINISLT